MEAKRIRLFGGMFYSAMVLIVISLGMVGTMLFNLPSMESTLYEMTKANGNIFYTVTLIIGYFIFVSFILMMGVIYHELGHAIAERRYGMERIFIRVYGLFAAICVSCKGDSAEDVPLLSPEADAVVDFAGGVLAGAMLLLVYAFTQSWAILLLFGMLIQYSAEDSIISD